MLCNSLRTQRRISWRGRMSTVIPTRQNRLFGPPHQHLTVTPRRSFRGVGPSLSWNASTVLLGNQEAAEVALTSSVQMERFYSEGRKSKSVSTRRPNILIMRPVLRPTAKTAIARMRVRLLFRMREGSQRFPCGGPTFPLASVIARISSSARSIAASILGNPALSASAARSPRSASQ